MDDAMLKQLWEIIPKSIEATPHAQVLGLRFISVGEGRATLCLPYNPTLIGNPDTRVLHGGAITTLLDQTTAIAAMSSFDTLSAFVTINLGINYMRAATPGETIIGSARCYKATKHLAFVRGFAHEGDDNDPIATADVTFMRTGERSSRDGKPAIAGMET